MSIPPVFSEGENTSPSSYGQQGIPPGKPLPASSPWVIMLQKMFPNVDPGVIATYASAFQQNMLQIFGNAIQDMTEKAHEAAQKMKRVIEGQE